MGILNDLWNLFFPRYCVSCGELLGRHEECLCMSCLVKLPRMSVYQRSAGEVEKVFWGKYPIEKATAFLYYTKGSDVRSILYGMKYYGDYRLAFFLGKCMAREFLEDSFFDGIDCLVPVPLHADRQRWRGYNQSEALAQGIATITGLPVCTDALSRHSPTDTQTDKSLYDRWLNVKGVFSVQKPTELRNKHILLIDDVLTTGATMTACTDALKNVEGIRVSILALAMAGG